MCFSLTQPPASHSLFYDICVTFYCMYFVFINKRVGLKSYLVYAYPHPPICLVTREQNNNIITNGDCSETYFFFNKFLAQSHLVTTHNLKQGQLLADVNSSAVSATINLCEFPFSNTNCNTDTELGFCSELLSFYMDFRWW